MKKKEKIIGAKVWALRGAKRGSLFVDEDGFLCVAWKKSALLKEGHHPTNLARIEIIEPRKKP